MPSCAHAFLSARAPGWLSAGTQQQLLMLGMAGVTLSHLLLSDAGPVKGSHPSRVPQIPLRFPCLRLPGRGGWVGCRTCPQPRAILGLFSFWCKSPGAQPHW